MLRLTYIGKKVFSLVSGRIEENEVCPYSWRDCLPTILAAECNSLEMLEKMSPESGPSNDSSREKHDSSSSSASASLFHFAIRAGYGGSGREITLRANYFDINIPSSALLHRYHVKISPLCPTKLNRAAFNVMTETYDNVFAGYLPMYDGQSDMYCKSPLPIGPDAAEFYVCLSGAVNQFVVTLQWTSRVSLGTSFQGDIPRGVTKALDVLLRQMNNNMYVPVGRSFFQPTFYPNHQNLCNGKEIWPGFHQRTTPSQLNMMLNVDVANAAFYKEQSVLELMHEVLGDVDLSSPLPDAARTKLERELRGVKIEGTHAKRRRYKVFGISRRPATTESFPITLPDGRVVDCTVPRYFKDRYNYNIQYQMLQCLLIGESGTKKFLPMEVCKIVGGQRCLKRLSDQETTAMIRTNASSSIRRAQRINDLVIGFKFDRDVYSGQSGITIDTKMATVPAQVLNPPFIVHGEPNGVHTKPVGGVWDMKDKTFITGMAVSYWALVCFAPMSVVSEYSLRHFVSSLVSISNRMGMHLSPTPCILFYAEPPQVPGLFRSCRKNQVRLVIAVLHGKSGLYSELKRLGDIEHGIPTQCVQYKKLLSASPKVLSNLCLKINTKVGGTNSILMPSGRPLVFSQPVIFLGGCLDHSTTGDPCKPTIAAVVGNMDAHPYRYRATVRAQRRGQDAIIDLTSMVKELLYRFYRDTRYKPVRIFYYRQCATEQKFDLILCSELCSIRRACMELEKDYQPPITFITVQKRHFTRLFNYTRDSKSGQCWDTPPGTVVDKLISHHSYFDFFLSSHTASQDTSKPTHYHVLWDDNKLGADDIYNVTYQLCHTYVRCTRSVSVPAPVYYAYLAGHRGRVHLADREFKSESNEMKDDSVLKDMNRLLSVHENAYNVMYFI